MRMKDQVGRIQSLQMFEIELQVDAKLIAAAAAAEDTRQISAAAAAAVHERKNNLTF